MSMILISMNTHIMGFTQSVKGHLVKLFRRYI